MEKTFHIKPQIRILGIDDSALIFREILIVGAFFRGGQWLDGVMHSYVIRDGLDATERIADMVISSKHSSQIRVIMLDGVTYGGFNPVDIKQLNRATGIAVIVVMRHLPDLVQIRQALSHLNDTEKRMEMILRAGPIEKVVTDAGESPIYIQCAGIDMALASRIVCLSCVHSNIPEPLRVAHMIATGMICGESRGQA